MMQQYKRILVALDGSDEANLAFQKAVNVALRNDAELVLLHVIDTRAFQSVSSFDSVMADEATKAAKDTLEEYVEKAKEKGATKISYVIEYGSPKQLISKDIPKDKQIDLIMIGATGLSAVERILIGSVSEYVIRHAICDVLVVRTDLTNQVPHD